MGVINSLILVAVGAILTWAVQTEGGTVDPQVVGSAAHDLRRGRATTPAGALGVATRKDP